ncbi:aspartyl protease [Flavobacterium limicola]|uniref:Aspartyl protease n=1 Tax=Flavobacterium limicola TaxID=180441 RepID=A0A495RR69_9FLAO|nr:aspartyl protease family protein [Flavobacterium limicola]RKS89646.1 aspartyl protease [Flavobacterium limicola]
MKRNLLIAFVLMSIPIFAQNIPLRDTISLTINDHNTIFIKAIFNEKDTLNLNFDTGTTELILTNDVLNNTLKSKPKLYSTFYNLKIGATNYKTKVYDAELAGHETDGRFGWDFFKGKVVELNYDNHSMIVHSELPKYVPLDSKFTTLKMEFWKDLFLVSSEIKENGIVNTALFLFDTGFDRTVLLDNDLLKEGNFPTNKMEFVKKVIMKGAQGNEIPVITSNLKTLKIGKYKVKNIPVQTTISQKPLRDKNVHLLGNEILKRFNLFLDFQKNVVYLKPNHLFNDKYIDQKKNGI